MSSLEKLEFVKPADIEMRSFEIITSELGDRVLDPENELVIKRVIHTSADFEYADTLVFSEHATTIGVEALRNGCSIVTDTKMAAAGINKRVLGKFGGTVHNFISDPDVAAEAKGLDASAVKAVDMKAYKEEQYDELAQVMRDNMDMELVYRIIEEGVK